MNLIFDLDGTLIDSLPDIHATANALLAAENLPPLDMPTVRSFIGHGVVHLVGRMLAAHGIADATRAARMVGNFEARYSEAVHLTRPNPGVPEALAALAADGHGMAICTNKPEAPARAVLDHLGLTQYFAAIIGGDTTAFRKPHPEPLNRARAALGPGPAVFVGDSEVDAALARAAGLPFWLFTDGYRHTPVAALAPEHAFDDFAVLPELVRS